MTNEEREAVFEQAHTPTSDERDALLDAEGWPTRGIVDVVMKRWSNDNDTIRRGEGDWSWKGLAETAIQALAQAGLLAASQPQAEPTDAQVAAARKAHRQTWGVDDAKMRAALSAAFKAGGDGR